MFDHIMQTMTQTHTLSCPYCSERHKTFLPEQQTGSSVQELVCVPYTRDIGRFDDGTWSKIGSDFLGKFIAWDEEIGILRVPLGSSIDVWYRVATCPACERLFDVFANYTAHQKMADFWPHLFSTQKGKIQPYTSHNIIASFFALSAKLFGKGYAGALLIAMLFLLIALTPDVFLIPSRGLDAAFIARLIVGAIGAALLAMIFHVLDSYAAILSSQKIFRDLFHFQRADHVTFWLNFTRSRFVGVQQRHRRYRITQADVVAGIPSALIMMCAWVIYQVQQAGIAPRLGFLLLFAGMGFLVGALATHPRGRNPFLGTLLPITKSHVQGTVLGIVVWFVILVRHLIGASSVAAVAAQLLYLAFWVVVAYGVGIAVYTFLGFSLYVLRAIQVVPTRASALHHYASLRVLENISLLSFSSFALITVFIVTIVAVVFVPLPTQLSSAFRDLLWIVWWGQWGLAALLLGYGVTAHKLIAATAIVYGGIVVFLSRAVRAIVPVQGTVVYGGAATSSLLLYPDILIFGLFLSAVVYLHTRSVARIIRNMKEDVRTSEAHRLGSVIDREYKRALGRRASVSSLRRLRNIIALRDYIERQAVSLGVTRRVVSILGPLFFAVIAPAIIETVIEKIVAIFL